MGTTGRISKNISYRTIGTVPPFKQSSWKLNEVSKLSKKRSNEHVSAEIHVSYLFFCVESGYLPWVVKSLKPHQILHGVCADFIPWADIHHIFYCALPRVVKL